MAAGQPTPTSDDALDARLPGYRFGIVLVLLLGTFVFLASSPSGTWTRLIATILQGVTLLAAMSASDASPGLFRIAAVVALVAVGFAIVSLFSDSSNVHGGVIALSALLVAVTPVVIANSVRRRGIVDAHTVLAAICVYVLIGMFFAFLYIAIGTIDSGPFFVQTKNATTADYLYFSYVTQTTVGYGDLTAAPGLGRPLAMIEALMGQLYLVTVLALLVSQLPRTRSRS
jgi:hypothetical protein